MEIKEALAMLGDIPEVTADEIERLRGRISKESGTCQALRREITSRFRETARRLANDANVDDLEFQAQMSHLAYTDVKILCQVQLAEKQGS